MKIQMSFIGNLLSKQILFSITNKVAINSIKRSLLFTQQQQQQQQQQSKQLMSGQVITNTADTGLPLKEVLHQLQEYASPSIAEGWDNVGLLLEPSSPHTVKHLFLTNDLTEDVLDEAVSKKADLILSYHPPIFSSIKRITQEAWKNRLIIKCLENRIAIYSPHTSYDVVKGGVNDWLMSCFHGDTKPIKPLEPGVDNGFGQGRICTLNEPLAIEEVVQKVKTHLGLPYLRLATAPAVEKVQSIASCAGSGSSVLRGVRADVFLTGEMSHHDVLDAVSTKTHVILCEHSNTERGFLRTLIPVFTGMLKSKVKVTVSELDKDPLVVV